MRYDDEELATVVFLLEGPETSLVYDLDGLDLGSVVDGTWLLVVHNLNVEDVLVGFLGAQMNMSLR